MEVIIRPHGIYRPWPKLRVFILGDLVRLNGHLDTVVPPEIRVLDIRFHSVSRETRGIRETIECPHLEHFRCDVPLGREKLSRVISPSLRNGNLKTLSISDSLDAPLDLVCESRHLEALGWRLDEFGVPSSYRNPKLSPWAHYFDLLGKFPNAHTFAVSVPVVVPGPGNDDLFGLLVSRPETRRIFTTSLYGVDTDKVLKEARQRNIEIINSSGFPVVFPWRLDDRDKESGQQLATGAGDVCEQWKRAGGRIRPPKVSTQPFFLE